MLQRLPRSIVLHPSVRNALSKGAPVVALESTILTHGLPYPTSLECGLALHDVVRKSGATPATIALLDGKVHVGVSDKALERLCRAGDAKSRDKDGVAKPIKTGERDIATVLALGKNVIGGTTVSGTLYVAHLLGIEIFATGGIGGVHRGAETSLDISSDLPSLARHPVGLFCSGAKSILDIPRTLEYLETQGVPVLTFHPGGAFPAFYTADSGCKVPGISSEAAAARILAKGIQLRRDLGIPAWAHAAGHLFGVPIPSKFEAIGQNIQAAVEQAVAESKENGVDRLGKEATPWLLQRVSELSKGSSLPSNVGLVVNNAGTAARTAVHLRSILAEQSSGEAGTQALSLEDELFRGTDLQASTLIPPQHNRPPRIIVFGLGAIDVTSSMSSTPSPVEPATYPGQVALSLGGVGRNVAEAAHRVLQCAPSELPCFGVQLVAPLGRAEGSKVGTLADDFGKLLQSGLAEQGMRIDGLFCPPSSRSEERSSRPRTPVCSLVLSSSGDLVSGVADMDISRSLDAAHIRKTLQATGHAGTSIAFDANLSTDAMAALLGTLSQNPRSLVLFEPTSVSKSLRILEAYTQCLQDGLDPEALHVIHMSTPNMYELTALYARAIELGLLNNKSAGVLDTDKDLQRSTGLSGADLNAARQLSASGILGSTIFLKLGAQGVLTIRAIGDGKASPGAIELIHHPIPLPAPSEIVNTTGAGDTFAGVVLAAAHLFANSGSTSPRSAVDWNAEELARVVRLAQKASALTLQSPSAVSPLLESVLEPEVLELCYFGR